MSNRIAIVTDGVVTDVIIAEDASDFPDGHLLPEDSPVGPGWTHDDNGFTAPPPPPDPGPSFEAQIQQQINELTDLILFGF